MKAEGLREALDFLIGCQRAGSLSPTAPSYVTTNYLMQEVARREGISFDQVIADYWDPEP